MADIGKYNELQIVRESKVGLYLDGGDHGEILMPFNYAPKEFEPGDIVKVFVYSDSEDRLVATTEEPYGQVDDFAYLKVKSVNNFGAFLDWGLLKDLLVPFGEQFIRMKEGNSYLVRIYIDRTGTRIAASSFLKHYVDSDSDNFDEEQKVDILVAEETEIGYKVIIDNTTWGFIYKNEIFGDISIGLRTVGYIKKIRMDDKIDISLEQEGYQKIDALSQKIIEYLKGNNGFCALTDKSDPERIYNLFEMSKKNFKKSIGNLYRRKLIKMDENGIKLIG